MRKVSLDMNMMLSDNFTLREFVRSSTAERYGIDNTPSWQHVTHLINLCNHVLQPLRNHFGPITINSGYRCERLNERVGGVGNSQHLTGCAADIRIANLGMGLQYYDWILDNTSFDQLLFEYRRNGARWLHVSCKPDIRQNRHMAIPNYKVEK